ncbi:hypothetical protein [Bacillus weihaiensis]|uniref:hypothetical protein n=1 Tax=Bacillus weihaiensis TaxID=1547283 RepID=UPI0018F1364B|nr:hypothetical protein [Bacillus weihaiensis]
MWVLTVYANETIKMYEFDNEKEAKESCQKIEGTAFLSHVVYFNDEFVEAVS